MPDKVYVSNPVHRIPNSGHSRWTISEEAEVECFLNCDALGWVSDSEGWGLHDINGQIAYVGVTREGHDSFHVRFIDTARSGAWHGFPASHKDRPTEAILADWLQNNCIRVKAVKLLSRGIRCTL